MRTRIALGAATAASVIVSIATAATAAGAGATPRTHHHLAGSLPASEPNLRAIAQPATASASDTVVGRHVPGTRSVHTTASLRSHHRTSRPRHEIDVLRRLRTVRLIDARWWSHPPRPTSVPAAPAPPAPAPPAPAPPAPAPPAPAPVVVAQPVAAPVSDATTTNTNDWACIRVHESGNRYNTPSAPSGAYGILDSTWLSMGYSGWPYQASPTVQSTVALSLYHEYGWQPWTTRFVCGL